MEGREASLPSARLSMTQRSETVLSLGLLGVLVVLLVPLPSVMLDMLLATNMALTILLLLITVSVKQPLDISVFPSLLLLMTLFRLSLNVATTRLILLHGDAGRIVSTFGGFVVGGNLIVGLVIFLILIVIQFIVITKGAGRVSEVAARFTLDALPGKQMAIDAELGAGTIDESEARTRRDLLTHEAEFYGAMDGAGKFVRGDAIAGLVVTGINLVGGVILGVTGGLSLSDAFQQYSILTVGDGLVSQIPALIIATAAGILVTKATTKVSLGHEIGTQLLSNTRPLAIGALILLGLAVTPGLPKLPFLFLSAALWFASRRLHADDSKRQSPGSASPAKPSRTPLEEHIEGFLQHDRACVEIGVRLIPLVDSQHGKGLADRISGLRHDLARKHGIWVPAIRMRDSLHLAPDSYRILIAGREVGRGQLHPDQVLAIDPGETSGELEGETTVDPAFGLPARWISPQLQSRAEMKGYTVVDAATVLITHLGEILRRYAHELLSREDLRRLLDKVKETSPSLVEELKPDLIRMGDLHQALVLLLQERVPLTNLTRILETIVQFAPHVKTPADLAERIRQPLGREILDRLRDDKGRVSVLVLDPRLEVKFRELLRERQLVLSHDVLERLLVAISQRWEKGHLAGRELALLTDGPLRRPLRQIVERSLPDLTVTSYGEIPTDLTVDVQDIVKLEEVYRDAVEPTQATVAPPDRSGVWAAATAAA